MGKPLNSQANPLGYWYKDSASERVKTLNLLREYREAERLMRLHARDDMAMNENELRTLRFLLKKQREQVPVLQRDLVDYLKITGASASALVCQLEKGGYLKKVPHPFDRRAVLLEATAKTDAEVRDRMGKMHERMLEAIYQLDDTELAGAQKFLRLMIATLEEENASSAPSAQER